MSFSQDLDTPAASLESMGESQMECFMDECFMEDVESGNHNNLPTNQGKFFFSFYPLC